MKSTAVRDQRGGVPRLPPRNVPRTRLLHALDEAVERPLTLVTAGPGSGKTALLADWAKRRDPVPAWVSLDAGHNDPVALSGALRAALEVAGIARQDWSDLLVSIAVPESAFENSAEATSPDVRFAYETLTDETLTDETLTDETLTDETLADVTPSDVASNAGRVPAATSVVVILDNAHVLTDPEMIDRLDQWVRNLNPRLRLVFAARSVPALPLHRYRLAGTVSELNPSELAATTAETAQLLHAHAVHLAGRDVELLAQRTEGWIAGIRLTALRMQAKSPTAPYLTDGHGDGASIGHYLIQEVFLQQPLDTQRLLVETSFLSDLTSDLAIELTGLQSAGAILAELARTNSFVIPTDRLGSGFRYHHMLLETLRQRLDEEPRAHRDDLQRRAARWFMLDGDAVRAIHHAAAAGDWRMTARLLARGGIVQAFVGCVPIDPLDGNDIAHQLSGPDDPDAPELIIGAAAAFVYNGKFQEAAAHLRRLATPRGVLDDELSTSVEVLKLLIARALHRVSDADAAAQQLLLACAASGRLDLAGSVRLAQAMTRYYADSHDSLEPLLIAAAADAAAAQSAALELACVSELAHVNAFWARYRASQASSYRASMLLRDNPSLTAPASLLVAAAHRALGSADFSEAAKAERRARRIAARSGDPDIRAEINIVRAMLNLASGRLEDARRSLRHAPALQRGWTRDCRRALLIIIDICQRRVDRAVRTLETQRRDAQPSSFICLARGLTQLALGNVDAADAAIRPILTSLAVPSTRPLLITALTVQARGAAARGDADGRAAECLIRALELADGDIVLPFVGVFEQLGTLIARHPLLAAQWPVAAERTLIAALVQSPRSGALNGETLTNRETAVLRWLATSMSTSEIADELGLSVNTVKTHIAAIYRKLGAPRRRDAVLRARGLELL